MLTPEQVRVQAAQGLVGLDLDGRRVLVLIADGTRSMPMALLFDVLERSLAWWLWVRTLR